MNSIKCVVRFLTLYHVLHNYQINKSTFYIDVNVLPDTMESDVKATLMIVLEIPARTTPHVLIMSAHMSAPLLEDL